MTDVHADRTGPQPPRRAKRWVILGTAAAVIAGMAIAVPALADSKPDSEKEETLLRTTAQKVGVTRSYANPKSNLSLTAGGVGPSGKGEVFARIGGVHENVQSWNFLRDKIISRGASSGDNLRCLESDSGGNVFIAKCVTGKDSQKWAHKLAQKAPGAFRDQVRIQNFQSKKCLTIGSATGRGTAEVAAKDCKDEATSQRWVVASFTNE
ncbi:RICIN domain-containing protein [Streptomyces erythrochromogenes]|uniref:RICIN domain-containing protein n=1 Tax=Streptomyces erythrochromogenes TaxID=285574 RepID=A0ABZ1Q5K4_9ACTN|nr:ricin-type beta-trefoil lectin domain protein [Streptomyces erythrochromogenes]